MLTTHSICFRVLPTPFDGSQPACCPLKRVLSYLSACMTKILRPLSIEELIIQCDLLLEHDLAIGGGLRVFSITLGQDLPQTVPPLTLNMPGE